jgi:hypothetical protein
VGIIIIRVFHDILVMGHLLGMHSRETTVSEVVMEDVFDGRVVKLIYVPVWLEEAQLSECPFIKSTVVFERSR